MEIAREAKVIIIWNSKDVTKNLSDYISSVEFTDHEEGMSDEATFVFANDDMRWLDKWYPSQGDTIELWMGYNTDLFKCGLFEIDEIVPSGPPDVIEVKCIASGFSNAMRTRNCHAFEAQTLKSIANYFCKKYNLTLIDESNLLSTINVERKTQEEQTDLYFLSETAKEYGLIFSLRGSKMLFTSYNLLDDADAIRDISKNDISSYSFTQKMYDTYAAAQFTAHWKKKGKVNKQSATGEGSSSLTNWGISDNTKTMVNTDKEKITSNGSASQLKRKAFANLWNKNKFKLSSSIKMEGTTGLQASKNINLTNFGEMSGKYHIVSATHHIGDGSYETSLELRITGSIPKAKAVPSINGRGKRKKNSDTNSTIKGELEGW